MCYCDGSLYTSERRRLVGSDRVSHSLAVYQVQDDSGDITLLDRLELWTGKDWYVCPRVERHSRRVFVPCGDIGVIVAHLDGDKLVRGRTLNCVREPVSMDVMSPDTVYIQNVVDSSIHAVDVRDDRITSTLEMPDAVKDELPNRLAVLGDTIMVNYTDNTMVVYRHGSPAPVRVVPHPNGLQIVTAVSTDGHSHFTVTDWKAKSIFAMDFNGNLRHTVIIDNAYTPWDCAVVNGQLWVGCVGGDIVIMSSQ